MEHDISAHFEVNSGAAAGKPTLAESDMSAALIRKTCIIEMVKALDKLPLDGWHSTNLAAVLFDGVVAMHTTMQELLTREEIARQAVADDRPAPMSLQPIEPESE